MNRREFWHRHIRTQKQSGLTQAKYCAREGLSPSTFGYWVLQARKAAQRAEEGRFLPVASGRAAIEIITGGVTIRVLPGSDLSELRRVVEVLSC